jgi:hypothetical protein
MNKMDAEAEINRMLVADNARMRKAGCNLAEAAIRVIRDYDGIHRLSLAVSEWAKAVANEGNRELTASDEIKRENRLKAYDRKHGIDE